MKSLSLALVSSALLAGLTVPAASQGLLGIIGGSDDSALITLGSGDAGDKGLVNLGVGGDNQVLDLNIGNGSVGSATVGSGGSNGLLDADVNLLNDNVRVDANVGGSSGGVGVNVGIGGSGGGSGGGGGGDDDDGGGTGGGGDDDDGGGTGGGGGDDDNGTVLPPRNTGSAGSSSGSTCAGVSVSELDRLIRSTRIDASWQRASNVAVQRVQLCPNEQAWLAAALANTGLGNNLAAAVANDALLSASLSRSSFGPDRVFAVRNSGGQLIMYVY